MEMVTVSKGTSSRIPLAAPYTSVIVVRGRGLLQGIQVLSTWDTALVEQVEGVSEPEVGINGSIKRLKTHISRYGPKELLMDAAPS